MVPGVSLRFHSGLYSFAPPALVCCTAPKPSRCRPRHLARLEIVITLNDPNLGGEIAKLGSLSNLRCNPCVIFMDSTGQRVALQTFGSGRRGLNLADQGIDVAESRATAEGDRHY